MDALIRLENVSVISEEFEILKDISLEIRRERSTVVIGPSGCGKSTLLKTMAGILVCQNGKLFLEGHNFLKMSDTKLKAFKKRNGFVFQDAALWANRTIHQNMSLPLEFHFPEWAVSQREARIRELLEKTGLYSQAHLRPAQISTGEQKIVSFLRAIVTDPVIFFMDEPTLSIDSETAKIIYKMIRELKAKKCTIIAVTHDPELTSWLADDLVVLKGGRLLDCGPFDRVKNSSNQEVLTILDSVLGKAASFDTDILGLLNDR